MKIEDLANELIDLKDKLATLEAVITSKRDEMYNLLGHEPDQIYQFGGYKFQRTTQVTVLTVNKQNFIESLLAAGLSDSIRQQIISSALSESIREPGLRMSLSRSA